MASYSGATIYNDLEDPFAVIVAFQPVLAGGGTEPVDPKRHLNVGGAAVAIQ